MAKDLYTKLLINTEDNTKSAFSKTQAELESISQQLVRMQSRRYQLGELKIADILGRCKPLKQIIVQNLFTTN
jgi:hypothetical protein